MTGPSIGHAPLNRSRIHFSTYISRTRAAGSTVCNTGVRGGNTSHCAGRKDTVPGISADPILVTSFRRTWQKVSPLCCVAYTQIKTFSCVTARIRRFVERTYCIPIGTKSAKEEAWQPPEWFDGKAQKWRERLSGSKCDPIASRSRFGLSSFGRIWFLVCTNSHRQSDRTSSLLPLLRLLFSPNHRFYN